MERDVAELISPYNTEELEVMLDSATRANVIAQARRREEPKPE